VTATVLHRSTDAIDRIAEEVYLLSEREYVCAGTTRTMPARGATAPKRWLVAALRSELYRHYYLGEAIETEDAAIDRRPVFAREDAAFGRVLRAANQCRGYFETGWRIVRPFDRAEVALVEKDGLRLSVRAQEIEPAGDTTVRVRFPADRPYASPGYYFTIGSAGVPSAAPLARWYFHVRSTGAAALLESLTARLDEAGRPFMFKVLNDPAAFTRPDAAVLYTPRTTVSHDAPAVFAARASAAEHFGERVPAFTRRIAPGLAIADEPPQSGQPVSFGQHRCGILARGLVVAGALATADERRAAMREAVAAEGLRLEALHLNAGQAEFEVGAP
jgi:hypothetical protein